MARTLEPIAPGEILVEEFMKPLGVSQNKLARDIDVPPARIDGMRTLGRSLPARSDTGRSASGVNMIPGIGRRRRSRRALWIRADMRREHTGHHRFLVGC